MKKKKKQFSLEEEKKIANLEWEEYLSKLTKDNYDRCIMMLMMEKINNIDYRLIKEKRHDLLG